jgi:RNA polymerase sigma-70 factor, ECF subfamily
MATVEPVGKALPEELALCEGLRRGDEAAFAALLERHAGALLRFARLYVSDPAVAEDVVQETWVGVLRGIDRFEGRSSLRTWMFRILLNRIRSYHRRDGRLIPFSACFEAAETPADPAVEPERFLGAEHPRWPGHWRRPPESWGESPEERVLSQEVRACVERAVAALLPSQREVITLRDIEGWSSEEVCELLGITGANQRVLLHRARAKVRQALEHELGGV